jgi:hypothetical protein
MSPENPTMTVYIPKEVLDYLSLEGGGTVGFQHFLNRDKSAVLSRCF